MMEEHTDAGTRPAAGLGAAMVAGPDQEIMHAFAGDPPARAAVGVRARRGRARKRTPLEAIQLLTAVGQAPSAEKDPGRLMELILDAAKELTRADGGTLYSRTADDRLRFEIMMTDSLGLLHPQPRRNRPRPVDLAPAGPPDERRDLGGERAGRGQHLPLHRPLRPRRRGRGAGRRVLPPRRRPRPGGGRQRGEPRDHLAPAGEAGLAGAGPLLARLEDELAELERALVDFRELSTRG